MNARQSHPLSLAKAQRRIESLREELDWTVESVERLERLGRHDLALRLVDEQRNSLQRFVGLVTAEVAPAPRLSARRRVALFVAATVAVVLAFASLGVASDRTTPLQAVNSRFVHAEAIADPVARLRELISIYRTVRAIPNSADLRSRVAEVARRTFETVKADNNPQDSDLAAQANGVITDASSAPSSDGSPVQQLQHQLGTN